MYARTPGSTDAGTRTGISRAARHCRAFEAAAGEFDQVDAERFEHVDHPPRVVGVEAAALEVGGVELHRDREGR
ncbi:hypothetical protein AB0A77_27500 [Streptomyces varsoviensis]|uniref:hypothetical protein n=1 Tax=Streptomyces varsoviensis TaxID=67373 RepID=UPI0034104C04